MCNSVTFSRAGVHCALQPLEKRPGQPLPDEPEALRLWLEERKDDSKFVFTPQKGGALTTNAI